MLWHLLHTEIRTAVGTAFGVTGRILRMLCSASIAAEKRNSKKESKGEAVMFERPGKELKDRAQEYVLWRTMAAAILGALGGAIVIPMLVKNTALMVALILGVMIVAPVITYNICKTKALTMYAMGQLVDDVQTIREHFCKEIPEDGTWAVQPSPSDNTSHPEEMELRQTERQGVQVHLQNGEIICPICKNKQPANRNVCWICGQRFVK